MYFNFTETNKVESNKQKGGLEIAYLSKSTTKFVCRKVILNLFFRHGTLLSI